MLQVSQRAILVALALLTTVAASAGASAVLARGAGRAPSLRWWRPARNATLAWQYQLSDTGPASIAIVPGVELYIIDLDTAAGGGAARLRRLVPGVRVVCYFSAGTFEGARAALDRRRGIKRSDWAGLLGNMMAGWPDERWLDIRSPRLRSIMFKRLQYAKAVARCDGVDPDNVNGWENPTGFPLTRTDQLVYNRWLASAAHSLGLAMSLKNAQSLLPQLSGVFDFAVNEECFAFDGDCAWYRLPKFARKPVLGVQYCDADEVDPACFCPRALAAGWSFLVKRQDLGALQLSCASYCARLGCNSSEAGGSALCRSAPNDCALLGLGA